ncbi:bifunctional nuclease family protein [bacterium]|nr:bifunctional nuclease family protein [bacterium]
MALARVDFFDLRYDHRHRSPVLFLKDAEQEKYLPVWIGELEASSIELAYIRKSAPRPLTHDLFTNVLRELGVLVEKVVIDRLESRTYYATIFLEQNGHSLTVDCRPSDAVAIALRENCDIYVDDELMYNIKFVELEDSKSEEGEDAIDTGDAPFAEDDESFQDFLKRISPADFKDN